MMRVMAQGENKFTYSIHCNEVHWDWQHFQVEMCIKLMVQILLYELQALYYMVINIFCKAFAIIQVFNISICSKSTNMT